MEGILYLKFLIKQENFAYLLCGFASQLIILNIWHILSLKCQPHEATENLL